MKPIFLSQTDPFSLIANRDPEDGSVITKPRQIITSPGKRGTLTEGVLLGKTSSYNAVGDPFREAGNVIARKTNMDRIAAAGHEKNFSPSKIVKINLTPAYEHRTERVHIQINKRDEEGTVIVAPRNFATSPPRKGRSGPGTSFAGHTPFIKEPYEIPDILRKKELDYHHEALAKLGDKPFSQKAAKLKNGVFNQAGTLSYIGGGKRPEVKREINKCEHERAFRPSRPGPKGTLGTLDKFPEYVENPIKSLVRVKPVEGEEEKTVLI